MITLVESTDNVEGKYYFMLNLLNLNLHRESWKAILGKQQRKFFQTDIACFTINQTIWILVLYPF